MAEQDLREQVARIEAICTIIERPSADGDDRILVDADVAAQHARDCRLILDLISSTKEGWRPITAAILKADEEAPGGLCDSRDNTGAPFQSAWLECALAQLSAMIAASPSPKLDPKTPSEGER